MKLSEWLEDDRGFAERVGLVDALLSALSAFHENEPGARPALDPQNLEVEGGSNCRIEAAGRRLDPAGANYRAPETNEGAPYAPSADTFSAGVLTYQILSGRHPFGDSSSAAPATPLREVQPEVPRDLADAVMACLERDPEWRAKDISYLAEVAKRSRPAGKPGRAAARKTVAPEPRVAATRSAPTFGALQPRAKSSSSRLPLILGSIAGMLMLVGGLWFFTRPEPPPRESPRPMGSPTATPIATTTPVPTASVPAVTPTPTGKPTPSPTSTPTTAVPSVAPSQTPVPAATPTPLNVPTPRPTPSARPTTVETPTPPPAPSPVAVATPLPANGPAAISTVVPNKLKRPSTTLLDVRGSGLRPDHKGLVLKGRDVAAGVTVINQRFVNPTLVQVMVKIDDSAAAGTYQVLLVDAQGQATSPRPLEVTK
jgi:hypothetical protein